MMSVNDTIQAQTNSYDKKVRLEPLGIHKLQSNLYTWHMTHCRLHNRDTISWSHRLGSRHGTELNKWRSYGRETAQQGGSVLAKSAKHMVQTLQSHYYRSIFNHFDVIGL